MGGRPTHSVPTNVVVDSQWVTYAAAKGSPRRPGEGQIELFGGLPSVQAKNEFPHRLVLQDDTDDDSASQRAREASKIIAEAFARYKKSRLGQNPHYGESPLTHAVIEAFQEIKTGIAPCCIVGAADQDSSFWELPGDFFSAFEKDKNALARLKLVNSLRIIPGGAVGAPAFATDAAKWHYDRLEYTACPGAVVGQEANMTISLGDVVSVQLDSHCAYSFSGQQHDLWVVKEIFLDRQDRVRLDCQLLVHPGDHEGHLRGHGQSSFDEHAPWEMKRFRERAVVVAKEKASRDARNAALRNAKVMAARHARHPRGQGCTSGGLLTCTDVPDQPAHVHVPDLKRPNNLALARHGRPSGSKEVFLLSDEAQGLMCTLIGLEHVRAVVRDIVFLEPEEPPPVDGRTFCKFVQHARDRRYTDLVPPKIPRGLDPGQRPLKLFAGAGGLDHAAPEAGWTVDSCLSSCLTNKANKPAEEVYHMGVEEFVVMCQAMDQLHAQLQQEGTLERAAPGLTARVVAEDAARQFTRQQMGLKPYIRDATDKGGSDIVTFPLNNAEAVKDVLEIAHGFGSFSKRKSQRVRVTSQFADDTEKQILMTAICGIARDMHSEDAATNKAEIEALHLDELFIDVYLPHFMQVYATAFVEAFVSGTPNSAPAPNEAHAWELTLACMAHLHAGLIPKLHVAVCRAVSGAENVGPGVCPGPDLGGGQEKILEITDFRLADAAERFSDGTKLKGFLKHELMRVDTTLFFCCETAYKSVWLPAEVIVASGGKQKLASFIQGLKQGKRLPSPGAVSTILAGPPCQDISAANPHSSKTNVMETDQVRNNMVFPLLKAVEYFGPRFAVIEQVPVALFTDKGAYATTVLCHLLTLGYQVHVRVINSEECGAPQSRRRMFILAAARGELLPEFPDPMQLLQSNHFADAKPGGVAPAGCSRARTFRCGSAATSPPSLSGLRGIDHKEQDAGNHKACLWDAISDLPHVSNGAYLGMIHKDHIAMPRTIFQVGQSSVFAAAVQHAATGAQQRLAFIPLHGIGGCALHDHVCAHLFGSQ